MVGSKDCRPLKEGNEAESPTTNFEHPLLLTTSTLPLPIITADAHTPLISKETRFPPKHPQSSTPTQRANGQESTYFDRAGTDTAA